MQGTQFPDFYRQQYARTVRLAYVLTGSPQAAQDLTQEAFFRLHRNWDRAERPDAYLRSILVNRCITWRQRDPHTLSLSPNFDVPAPPQVTAELLGALERLPARQRAAILLRYYDDYPDVEIAQMLDCRPATVRSLIHRGLARLRKEVQL